eukprot:scaffold5364_cov164-Amphora_coffeaeformis.AAC.18
MKCFRSNFAFWVFLGSSLLRNGGLVAAEVRGAQLHAMNEGPEAAVDEGRQLMYYYGSMEKKSMKYTRTPFYYGYQPMKKIFYSKGAYQATEFGDKTSPTE